ncbi:MAG TPA: bile acid:sodium symporter [Anaerolineales bacterium]|nr:bile acid:sodium symporter [Anaerolineales bacterium]
MSELISTLANLFTTAFVVTSMFSFGLRLTLSEIIEPLRDVRLLLMTLAANFVIVPLVAVLLANLIGLGEDLRIGLILISIVAGAPLVPKLAQIAKADIPFAVASTALLVVATVIYLPLVFPLVLPGIQLDMMNIIRPLAIQIVLPLVLGLIVDYISKDEADVLLPVLGQIANVSLTLMLVLMLGGNVGNVIGLIGTGSLIAAILLFAVAMAAGYFLGGADAGTRRTLSMATGQRNLAAAFVVATGSFADRPTVLVFLAAAGLIALIMMMPIAGWFGKRAVKDGTLTPAVDTEVADANVR